MVSLISGKDRILADCPPEKSFWVSNGVTCRNIFDLAENIAKANDYVFSYHVNKDHKKNDFADWIRQVLGDDVLAERLHAIKDKDLYVEVIRERIKELKSM
jgi:hypothetical protein